MQKNKNNILHIKMDWFMASIEQRDNPDLKGKAIAIGDSNRTRGVIAASSYEARKFGITSAIATKNAKKKCPKLIILPPRMKYYREESKKYIQLLRNYCDRVQLESLDSAILHLPKHISSMQAAIQVAKQIKKSIQTKLDLTSSVGISYNKFLSKLACNYQNPDGLTAILPQNAPNFLQSLSINNLPQITLANQKKMNRLGIHTCGDIIKKGKVDMGLLFGRNGSYYLDLAQGKDASEVADNENYQWISLDFDSSTKLGIYAKNIYQHLQEKINLQKSKVVYVGLIYMYKTYKNTCDVMAVKKLSNITATLKKKIEKSLFVHTKDKESIANIFLCVKIEASE